MCNTETRITDRRRQKRAAKAMRSIVGTKDEPRKGQRGAARLLHINPGTVNYILLDTPAAWTHVTLTPVMLAEIELLAEIVNSETELNDKISGMVEQAFERVSGLTALLRDIRREVRKL